MLPQKLLSIWPLKKKEKKRWNTINSFITIRYSKLNKENIKKTKKRIKEMKVIIMDSYLLYLVRF